MSITATAVALVRGQDVPGRCSTCWDEGLIYYSSDNIYCPHCQTYESIEDVLETQQDIVDFHIARGLSVPSDCPQSIAFYKRLEV